MQSESACCNFACSSANFTASPWPFVSAQVRDEYEAVKNMPPPEQPAAKRAAVANGAAPSLGGATEVTTAPEDAAAGRSSTARMLDNIVAERPR